MLAHPPEVTLEIAAVEKARQRQLLERRDGAAVKAHLFLPGVQQPRRQDHIADAERGRDGLGKRVHINYAPGKIHRLHRRDGPAGEAEFGVVIVLDQEAMGVTMPVG